MVGQGRAESAQLRLPRWREKKEAVLRFPVDICYRRKEKREGQSRPSSRPQMGVKPKSGLPSADGLTPRSRGPCVTGDRRSASR